MIMNYKLEKFWNIFLTPNEPIAKPMNYKLEKFWNNYRKGFAHLTDIWTINLKSFEITP